MLPNNRRKSIRKCVLDTEIPNGLKYRIRKEIIKERKKLRDIIDERVEKENKFENEVGMDYKNLGDEELYSRIKYLENKRVCLIKILSKKNEIYSQILRKVDELRQKKSRVDISKELEANKRQEMKSLENNTLIFHQRINKLINFINENRKLPSYNTNENTNFNDKICEYTNNKGDTDNCNIGNNYTNHNNNNSVDNQNNENSHNSASSPPLYS
ncbi:hypothetical protein FG379_002468 [Cryptosporidium bovis]|uniref:uncharacterized protein n=1 Tax=Cryptosporidium bovis TaxID=310047 RepID=UPI00351A3CCF|nr:hypothetical protein FG379_002468 [Cryptosporidium bovis]